MIVTTGPAQAQTSLVADFSREAEAPRGSRHTIASVFASLQRQWQLAAIVGGAIFSAVLLLTFLLPATYNTSAELLVDYVAPISYGQSATVPAVNDLVVSNDAQTIETYAALVESSPVAWEVIRRLHLNTNVQRLEGNIDVTPLTNTNVLQITASARSPGVSARIANMFAQAAIDNDRLLNARRAREAVISLSRALAQNHRIVEYDDALQERFESAKHLIDPANQSAAEVAQASTVEDTIWKTEADRANAKSELIALEARMNHEPTTVTAQTTSAISPVLSQLQQTLAQVMDQLEQARSTFTPRNPTVAALERQRLLLERRIAVIPKSVVSSSNAELNPVRQQLEQNAAMLAAQVKADDAQLKVLHAQQVYIGGEVQRFPAAATQLAALKRQSSGAESVYEALKAKYAEAVVANTIAPSSMSLVQPADAANALRRPRILLDIAIGLVLAIVLGVAAAVFRDLKGARVRNLHDTAEHLGVPAVAHLAGSGQALQPADALRVRQFAAIAALRNCVDLHCLSIASAVDSRKGRTAAMHFAHAFADVYEAVLLVDADASAAFDGGDLGVSDILTGRASFEQCVPVKVDGTSAVPGVTLLPIGTSTGDLLKRLSSQSLPRFVAEVQKRFGYGIVVVQCPPVTQSAEAVAICASADLTILELVPNAVSLAAAREAVDLLADSGAALAGIVVTGGQCTPEPKRARRNPLYESASPRCK